MFNELIVTLPSLKYTHEGSISIIM